MVRMCFVDIPHGYARRNDSGTNDLCGARLFCEFVLAIGLAVLEAGNWSKVAQFVGWLTLHQWCQCISWLRAVITTRR